MTIKRTALPLLLLAATTLGRDNYPRQTSVDILHYRIHVEVDEGSDTIIAKTEILFLTKFREIRLDFSGFFIEKISEGSENARFERRGEKLRIDLNHPHRSSDTCRVIIHYTGKPADGLIIGKNKFGNRTIFADNWPDRAHCWFPSIDHPYDKATVEFFVTAPRPFQVIASGVLRDTMSVARKKTWHWSEHVPLPTYCMVFGAAEFYVNKQGVWNGIPVVNYLYPADSTNGVNDLSHSIKILEYFSNLIGPYPYEKLALVQSTTRYGGMENAGNIFFSERAINGTARVTGTIAHEIAHQWFGDAVTEADWHHLWLSEGFASYFGPLYFEHLFGRDTLKYLLSREKESYFRSQVVNRPIYDTTITNLNRLLNANNYSKGGWVLHMLRGLMGDDKFFAGIREYYKTYRNRNALTEDFQAIMEKHARQDLDWFFRQWIYEAGYPKLEVSWRWDDQNKEVKLLLSQKQDGFFFRLPMELEFRDGSVKKREKVVLEKKDQVFSFRITSKPTSVVVDPDDWVLKEIALEAK